MNILKKYRQQILYIIFGVITTLINIITYEISYKYMLLSNVSSNIIAFIISVLFSYFTNKIYVFESKDNNFKLLLKELFSFFGCRLFTGILDITFMFISVDILSLNAFRMKIISNVFVIIVNYALSKNIVFRKR